MYEMYNFFHLKKIIPQWYGNKIIKIDFVVVNSDIIFNLLQVIFLIS